MITNHSNPLEAWIELVTDHDKLKYFRGKRKKLAMSMARKADVYPYFETVDYTPPATNNTYKVFWRTDEAGANSLETVSGQYLPVQDSKGKNIYLYSPETCGKIEDTNAYLWVITPHFQSRYRERAGMKPVVETTELIDHIIRNVPGMALTVVNHEKVNRNVHRYRDKVDDKTCNCYIPMRNGIAFIDETIYKNPKGKLPKNVYVIEMRTFVNTEGLTPGQREAISKDIKDFFDKNIAGKDESRTEAKGAAKKKAKGEAKTTFHVDEIKKGISKLDELGGREKAEVSSKDLLPVDDTAKYRQDILEYARRMVKKHNLHIVDKDGNPEDLSEDFLKNIPIVPLDRELRRSIEMSIVKYVEMRNRMRAPAMREFSDSEIDDILAAKASGSTLARLAATYHTNQDVIRRVLDENEGRLKTLLLKNVGKKKNKQKQDETQEDMAKVNAHFDEKTINEMVEMYKGGTTRGVIAKKFHTTTNSIYHILAGRIKDFKENEEAEPAVEKKAVAFTEQQVADILLQCAKGDECKVIAARFEATTEDIVGVINANPVRLAKMSETLAAEKAKIDARAEEEAKKEKERAEIISMYTKEGATIQEITSIFDRPFRYIKKILTDAGVEIIPSRRGSGERKDVASEMSEQILELRRQGLGTNKIGMKLGLSSSTVYAFLQKNEDPLGIIKLKEPKVNEKAPELPFEPEESPAVLKEEPKEVPAVVKEAAPATPAAGALDAFSVADIFRHLYSLGYYIPDGKVNFRHEVEVAEDDEMITNLRKAGYNIDPKTVTRTVVDVVDVDLIIADAKKED